MIPPRRLRRPQPTAGPTNSRWGATGADRSAAARGLALAAALALTLPVGAQPPGEYQLRDAVVIVRSIEAADHEFADLDPLVATIGSARVVQLGESSHGAGATFAAKVRLVEFLHERMGFDVLVWESGMFDLAQVDRALRDGDDSRDAGRGIFSIWSDTTEVAPLFDYVRRSHAGPRPLHMAGFDMQFSGRRGEYADELRAFVDAIEPAPARDHARTLADDAIVAYEHLRATETRRPTTRDLEIFLAAVDTLEAVVQAENEALAAVHGRRQVAFIQRTIGNLRLAGQNTYVYAVADPGLADPQRERLAAFNAAWNRRDERNAENLLWLLNEYYPGRKLIVWAHNGHIMNAHYAADWGSLAHGPQPGGMKPVGVWLREAIGEEAYSVGFTAYRGRQRQQGGTDILHVRTAPDGSLEHALHTLGEPYLFLDFRSLPATHRLRQPSTMAIRGYLPEVMEDWTRVVDGMFFIDTMTPSTPRPPR